MKSIIKNASLMLLSLVLVVSFCVTPVRAAGFSVGTTEGDTYANEFFGKKLVLPKGYTFLEGQELATQSGTPLKELNDPAGLVKTIDGGDSVIICYAFDSTGKNNINVSLAKIDMDNEQEVMNILKDFLSDLYTSSGYVVNKLEVNKKKVAGEDHYVLSADLSIGEVNCYQEAVTFLKDGYAMTLTASAFTTDETDKAIANIENTNISLDTKATNG